MAINCCLIKYFQIFSCNGKPMCIIVLSYLLWLLPFPVLPHLFCSPFCCLPLSVSSSCICLSLYLCFSFFFICWKWVFYFCINRGFIQLNVLYVWCTAGWYVCVMVNVVWHNCVIGICIMSCFFASFWGRWFCVVVSFSKYVIVVFHHAVHPPHFVEFPSSAWHFSV